MMDAILEMLIPCVRLTCLTLKALEWTEAYKVKELRGYVFLLLSWLNVLA